jgi:hypothetical protein
MSREEKRAYLQAIRSRYNESSRAKKAKILDEFYIICSYNRKHSNHPKRFVEVTAINFDSP